MMLNIHVNPYLCIFYYDHICMTIIRNKCYCRRGFGLIIVKKF